MPHYLGVLTEICRSHLSTPINMKSLWHIFCKFSFAPTVLNIRFLEALYLRARIIPRTIAGGLRIHVTISLAWSGADYLNYRHVWNPRSVILCNVIFKRHWDNWASIYKSTQDIKVKKENCFIDVVDLTWVPYQFSWTFNTNGIVENIVHQ